MGEPRLYRVIVLGGASLVGSATLAVICDAGCSGETAGPPVCNPQVSFASPCGFKSITSTCSGGPATCAPWGTPPGSETECTIGSQKTPITSDCTVSVVLGDGTKQDLTVIVESSAAARCVLGNQSVIAPVGSNFLTSPTCMLPEAGVDAETDSAASDAANEAESGNDAGGD